MKENFTKKSDVIILVSINAYSSFSVFKVLNCVICLFHVKRLLHEVISLAFIPGMKDYVIYILTTVVQ